MAKLYLFKLKHKRGWEAEVVARSYGAAVALVDWESDDTILVGEIEILGFIASLQTSTLSVRQELEALPVRPVV